ncbi:hypothetical protein NCC49_006414 [Naganishia albida]|nr:hypothetical protein NCC49_006414 [Naganishia albida]
MTILVGVETGHPLRNRRTVKAEAVASVGRKKQDDAEARVSVEEVLGDKRRRWSGREGINAASEQDETLDIAKRPACPQGLDSIAEPELAILKGERRAKRAARQKQKQLLRGELEIESWEPDNKNTIPARSSPPDSSSWEPAEGTTPHGWSSEAYAPISDEEWGEDRDWGGVPADLSELMVIDEEKASNGWSTGAEQEEWNASGMTESDSGFTITLRPSRDKPSLDEHDLPFDDKKEQSRLGPDMDIEVRSGSDPSLDFTDSPSPPRAETSTPLSPALSPEPGPSGTNVNSTEPSNARAVDGHTRPSDSLFSSFSAIRLGTPRKRQYPYDTAQHLDVNGALAETGATQDLHRKKKRSPEVE